MLCGEGGDESVDAQVDGFGGLDTDGHCVGGEGRGGEDGGVGRGFEVDFYFSEGFIEGWGVVSWVMKMGILEPAKDGDVPLPALSKKGTPAHRSFSICPTAAQNVAHLESSGTSSSSLKAGF